VDGKLGGRYGNIVRQAHIINGAKPRPTPNRSPEKGGRLVRKERARGKTW
jgi:hypothetical protein